MRRARARVGELEGRSAGRREGAQRASHAIGAGRRSAERDRVQGSWRGEAPGDARERSDRARRTERAPQRERVRLSGSSRGEAPRRIDIPLRGYGKGGDAENIEFVGVAA
jgi:hypothetical protein